MQVRDLISELQRFDPTSKVVVEDLFFDIDDDEPCVERGDCCVVIKANIASYK
jgi:hypothetical protein